jgi:hypothetical protein
MAPLLTILSMMVAWNHKDITSLLLHALAPHSTIMPRCNHTPNPKILLLPLTSDSLLSSSLFGVNQKRNSRYYSQRKSELFSMSGGGDDSNSKAVDAKIVTNGGSTSTTTTSTSFLRAVDNFGMKLKPWALSAYQRSLSYSNNAKSINGEEGTTTTPATGGGEEEKQQRMKRTSNFKSILCRIQSNILWVLYILYRGYRGFFVILPAVFREVYAQLNDSDLVVDVYGDEEMEEREYAVNKNANAPSQNEQVQQPMRLRTRITISILSGILTLSYVVSGALRVLGEFINLLV